MLRLKLTPRKSTGRVACCPHFRIKSTITRMWVKPMVAARTTMGSTAKLCPRKKYQRYRPGPVALREIRKFHTSSSFMIGLVPIRRLVREIAEDCKTDSRFKEIPAEVQEAVEAYTVNILRDMQITDLQVPSGDAKRFDVITPKDMQLALRIRGKGSST